MQRKPDETKKGLAFCSKRRCGDETEVCSYDSGRSDCIGRLQGDALALIQQLQGEKAEQAETIMWMEAERDDFKRTIQQLEADNAQLNRCIENMTDKLNAANDEVAKLQAERDAAVETIYEMAKCITEDVCEWCDGVECERLCMQHTILRPGFKWRGVTKEG